MCPNQVRAMGTMKMRKVKIPDDRRELVELQTHFFLVLREIANTCRWRDESEKAASFLLLLFILF